VVTKSLILQYQLSYVVGGSVSFGLHQAPQSLLVFLLSRWGGQAALNSEFACNNAIKVMRYTRRFWYEVQCALLVQRGTPYCGRYVHEEL